MPVYQVLTSGVVLTGEQRDILATRFTEAHHEVTRTRDPFVRIAFLPMPLGLMYTAGRIEPSFVLHADCRAGRSEITRRALMDKLYAVVRDVVDLLQEQILLTVTDTPGSWSMEAGRLLPEPTHQAGAARTKELQEILPGEYDPDRR